MKQRIDHEKLNALVREVEDRHENGIVDASEKEMLPIWKITKSVKEDCVRDGSAVSLQEYKLIVAYAAKELHTPDEKARTLQQLHKNYSWLNRRVMAYRRGKLIIRD